jgi:hypothetical protein
MGLILVFTMLQVGMIHRHTIEPEKVPADDSGESQ